MIGSSEISKQESTHGIALAYDPWAKNYGAWIILGFVAIFAIFLIGMNLAGQVPGKSFLLKGASDIIQLIGEGIGCLFCARIAIRLRKVSARLHYELLVKEIRHQVSSDQETARAEAQAALRAYLAWLLLAIAIALYAAGQAVWASYDVRMNSANVPFPGLYDIGFVASYPFFFIGTLLLAHGDKAAVRRNYLLLDVLTVIGASLALSWFFLLGPLLTALPHASSPGAAFLSIYFPSGDLFLVAVGAFLMFSPLATRAQQPAFLFLCTGLFFLAISDSLLGYYNLSSGFNTGTLQDVLWPASMQLIGLAAIEYPISISQEQRNNIPSSLPAIPALFTSNRLSQVLSIVLATLPLILILMTCALLLVNVSPRGGIVSLQSNLVVLALVLILIARQTLTLLENDRLIRQIHSKLVVSQGELDRKRREVDEAVRRMREKLEAKLEEDVKALRSVHSRVAHGDFSVRAPAISGPLQPVALSFNMMQDRLSSLTQQSTYHRQLAQEFRMVQEAIERLEQGLPAWSSSQPPAQCTRELRPVFLGLLRLQYSLLNQWRNLESALESVNSLARHLREGLSKMAHAKSFTNSEQSSTEHMLLELVISEATILEQQLKTVLNQVLQSIRRFESSTLPMQRLRSGDGSEPR